jgi:hypothetical protein
MDSTFVNEPPTIKGFTNDDPFIITLSVEEKGWMEDMVRLPDSSIIADGDFMI